MAEYWGPLAFEEQDYWVPRSTIMAESILQQTKQEHLRRVLLRFHRNVSPLRIPRYDVFTKWAYDASLLGNVFPDWREGKEFYEQAYRRDLSPYLRQQGALYLSHKHRYQDVIYHLESRHHRAGRNLEGLDNKSSDEHGDEEGQNNSFGPFPHLTLLSLAFPHHRSFHSFITDFVVKIQPSNELWTLLFLLDQD